MASIAQDAPLPALTEPRREDVGRERHRTIVELIAPSLIGKQLLIQVQLREEH